MICPVARLPPFFGPTVLIGMAVGVTGCRTPFARFCRFRAGFLAGAFYSEVDQAARGDGLRVEGCASLENVISASLPSVLL